MKIVYQMDSEISISYIPWNRNRFLRDVRDSG